MIELATLLDQSSTVVRINVHSGTLEDELFFHLGKLKDLQFILEMEEFDQDRPWAVCVWLVSGGLVQ